ncbi:type II toxin-antitoxin system HicB family antitoxin [Limosilactobacillus sp.]|jgi:predicted RNase H-like HicB family nuclease|uniref:type II toxin-antitoxin system HicB family antitoxin n=1 Tax=Limosilactobacillus sp. TaxID=2773925 RepID=UPI0025B99FF6|nr:type II toxin-antitoxin system HicB family antitoxin [Limosilactobacillus sp.]MCH3922982.1 type II toxin-antitoxin system HicB family antitoxin [Limosilactobacillus sp.]MCH3927665.1 type II toxin-antitoxin system HicB family antitoxin [Limosilactobacillus sp.]
MKTTDQIVVYPIIIKYEPDDTDCPYLVTIPDLDNGMTQGKSIADAIAMAEDYIGTTSLEESLPTSNYALPQTKKNETVTLVRVNVSEYKRKHDNKVVKKTITIPNYLNELGKENGINFSEVMTNALRDKFSI